MNVIKPLAQARVSVAEAHERAAHARDDPPSEERVNDRVGARALGPKPPRAVAANTQAIEGRNDLARVREVLVGVALAGALRDELGDGALTCAAYD
jgi:hypothetical protein